MAKNPLSALTAQLSESLAEKPRKKPARVLDLDVYDEDDAPQAPPVKSPPRGIPQKTIPQRGIPQHEPPDNLGYYPTFNDLTDNLIPRLKLDPYAQSVLQRMYRLSRGYKSDECEVGLGGLVKQCNMSRSRAQEAVAKLVECGVITPLGSSQKGTRYKVLPQYPAVPLKGMPEDGIPHEKAAVYRSSQRGIPQGGNIKKSEDHLKNKVTKPIDPQELEKAKAEYERARAELEGEGKS